MRYEFRRSPGIVLFKRGCATTPSLPPPLSPKPWRKCAHATLPPDRRRSRSRHRVCPARPAGGRPERGHHHGDRLRLQRARYDSRRAHHVPPGESGEGRSEERRVGKERRLQRWPYHEKKNIDKTKK